VLKELKEELASREHCDYSTVTQSGDTSTKEDQKLPLVKKSGGKGPPSTFALMAGSDGNQKPACVSAVSISHLLSVILSPMPKSVKKC